MSPLLNKTSKLNSSRKDSIFGEKKFSAFSGATSQNTHKNVTSPPTRTSIMDQQGNILIEQHNYNKYISNNPTSLNSGRKVKGRLGK